MHLLEDCPALALQRSQVQYNHIMHLPRAFRVSLLVPQPLDLQEHIADLCNLPHDDVGMLLPAGVHLFTDGSTMYGKEMTLAISSWAVSLAELGSIESTCVVAAPLPGPVQTNNRAELYAVLQAVLSAPSGFLYSDSLVTVKGFQHLQKFGWVENQWKAAENYDLWHRLAQAVQDWSSWQITWIPSHRDAEAALSDWDAWCFHHNNAVDILAKRANKNRSEQFLRRHADLLSQQQRSSQQLDLVVNFQTQVAAVTKLGPSQRDTMVRKPPGSSNAVDCTYLFLDRLGMLCNDKQCSRFAPNSFPERAKFVHLPYARALWAFLESQTWVQDSGGCSILELYIAFLSCSGCIVPKKLSTASIQDRPLLLQAPHYVPVWALESEWPQVSLNRASLSEQCRVFGFFMREVLRWNEGLGKLEFKPNLKFLDSPRKFLSLGWRPKCLLNHSYVHKLRALMNGVSFSALLRRPFHGLSNLPSSIPCEHRDVLTEYRRYKSAR